MTKTQRLNREQFWAQEDIFETNGTLLIMGLVICFAAVVIICAFAGIS